MSMSSVLIISLAAGVVLVVGGGLLMYMANLVKNAYEIKVQINADMDERLKAIGEDLDKKSKWIKRDLIEELDKMKTSLISDNNRRLQELVEPFSKRLESIEQKLQMERGDWSKAVDDTKVGGQALDAKLNQLRKDLRRVEIKVGLEPSSGTPSPGMPSAGAPTPPKLGETNSPMTGAPSAASKGTPPVPPKPETPKGPQSVTSILPEL